MIRSAATYLPALLAVSLAACGANDAPATAASVASSPATAETAVAHVGDVTMRASAMQTSSLDAGVAKGYGITRSDTAVLLLVAVRKGAEANETAVPATITATATDLAGRKHAIAMRELRIGDAGSAPGQAMLDYVGTLEITLPDTLRFEVEVVLEGGARSRMQFNREFFPR